MVSSIGTIPTQPVVLDNINMNMIDNMFIVNPPREIRQIEEDEGSGGDNNSDGGLLDFTDLDINYLDDDYLAEDDLEFNELDMDLLDVDFLQDVLVALEKVSVLNRKSSTGDSSDISGTSLGFDKELSLIHI